MQQQFINNMFSSNGVEVLTQGFSQPSGVKKAPAPLREMACLPEVMQMYIDGSIYKQGAHQICYMAPDPKTYPRTIPYLVYTQPHQFNCCGASIIESIGMEIMDTKTRQNIVCQIRRHLMTTQNFYFIAANYQLELNNTVANLLRELGAEEVDVRPNYNHAPHTLHLHVFSPKKVPAAVWDKYVYHDPVYGFYNPLWYHQLKVEEQAKLIEAAKPLIAARFAEEQKKSELRKAHARQNRLYTVEDCLNAGEVPDDLLRKFGYVRATK
jgi:hypothetical protein